MRSRSWTRSGPNAKPSKRQILLIGGGTEAVNEPQATSGVTGPSTADDASLVARIIAAYRAASATTLGDQGPVWLSSIKYSIHDALMSREAETVVAPMLRDPGSNMLFYGFDNLSSGTMDANSIWDNTHHVRVYDDLLRLGEAVGIQRLEYPEGPEQRPAPDPEVILRDLDAAFGFTIHFPNPYPNEVGLKTSRGVASYRAVQALYQAYRVAELVRDRPNARVLEIGGGLGRTAFYAHQFGLRDYTLIDLPMTNVAQAYFLGRVLGPDAICLFGEDRPGIRIQPPAAFLDAADRYDLVVNVDALPEMAADTATAYCQAIKARADMFLSINHEYNDPDGARNLRRTKHARRFSDALLAATWICRRGVQALRQEESGHQKAAGWRAFHAGCPVHPSYWQKQAP